MELRVKPLADAAFRSVRRSSCRLFTRFVLSSPVFGGPTRRARRATYRVRLTIRRTGARAQSVTLVARRL